MASGLKAWWILSILLVVSNWHHQYFWRSTYGYSIPQVSCYFIFGDSLFSNGNNDYLNTTLKCNYLPYGIDFPYGSTGRCGDALNVADAIGKELGFDDLIPEFGMATVTNYINGVNYASSGAGILNTTGELMGDLFTMDIQLSNHKIIASRLFKKLGPEAAKKHLSQCIYVVDMGHNDYLNHYFLAGHCTGKLFKPERFAEYLIETYKSQLEKLYHEGARKVAVFGLVSIGCMPSNIQKFGTNGSPCAEDLNQAIQHFNKMLHSLILELNTKLSGAIFTYINSFGIDTDTTDFKVTNLSCCEVPFGSVTCTALTSPCTNRSEFVYWDGAHFTEAKALAFGKRAYNNLKYGYPHDISRLSRVPTTDDYYPKDIHRDELG